MNPFIILLFASLAFSQDFVFDKEKGRAVPSYVGQIKLLKGRAYKKNAEGTTAVKTGERFKKSDLLITEDKSFARIQIVDDSILSIGPKSELRFDEIDFKEKTDRKLTFSLLKGQLTGDIKNKAKPGEIKFRTKYTSMGVRGTYFLMNHQKLDSLHIAEYAVLSGSIAVTDDKNKLFPVGKGEKIVLIHDSSREISAEDKVQISPDEFQGLKGDHINEEKEIRPFLPLFKVSDVNSGSPLYPILNTGASQEETQTSPVIEKRKQKSFTLDQKLDQLNQKLRENQKRR